MTAFNVVRMRVKEGCEDEFLAKTRHPGEEVRAGLRRAWLVKTGERAYCFIGEWENKAAISAAMADMIRNLDDVRPLLEDIGGGAGATDAISGEAVAEAAGPSAASRA